LKGKACYSEGGEDKKKENRKNKNKKMGWSTASFLFFFSRVPLVMQGMETCIIYGSCSSLEQRAFPVNPNEMPHLGTGVGEVK
jgi:hypothetical protein